MSKMIITTRQFRPALTLIMILVSLSLVSRPTWHTFKREKARQQAAHYWLDWKAAGVDDPERGNPAFWLQVPSASINSLVIYGSNKKNLTLYPTVDRIFKSQSKNVPIVLAHRDTHFRNLHRISIGDPIMTENSKGLQLRLQVSDKKIVSKEDAERTAKQLINSCETEALILITCYPTNCIGPAPQRLLVLATPPPATGLRFSSLHSNAQKKSLAAKRVTFL